MCRCVCACLRARVDRDLFASVRTWCIRVPACTAAVSSSSKPSSTASMSIKVMSGKNMVCYICCPPLQAQPHTYIHQVFHLVVRTQGGRGAVSLKPTVAQKQSNFDIMQRTLFYLQAYLPATNMCCPCLILSLNNSATHNVLPLYS